MNQRRKGCCCVTRIALTGRKGHKELPKKEESSAMSSRTLASLSRLSVQQMLVLTKGCYQ